MPWSEKQNKLFRAAEHDPEIAREHGLSHDEARKLAHEGVKDKPKEKKASVEFIDLSPVFGRRS